LWCLAEAEVGSTKIERFLKKKCINKSAKITKAPEKYHAIEKLADYILSVLYIGIQRD